ncbi:MAG TPA: asparagine synthetase B, partial [Sulfuricurvum sp.]|nr:asparagine synthetase B [Sulfuricurvum sp.]
MCGVFGIIGNYTPAKARAALQTLSHRGRDYCGIVEENELFLAHQRLSITDNHPRSHQPLRHKSLL